MPEIYNLQQIKAVAESMDFSSEIEAGFIAYSNDQVVVPPVGELTFDDPPGDTHIKYGYIKNDNVFVVKIASGFYQNVSMGLPSSSGLMLVFSQSTGVLDTILLDEGYLTNVRTAVAGRIVAKLLSPATVQTIGVFGTGTMARMQVSYLDSIVDSKSLMVWGRSEASLSHYKADMVELGFDVVTTQDPGEVVANSNFLIMTTPSEVPLINQDQIRPGTHITAIGSDTAEKQELDASILQNADLVVTDSLPQCQERGEIYQALRRNQINLDQVTELGKLLAKGQRSRRSEEETTIADLTGVAVQDVQIAKAVCNALKS